MNKPLLHVVSFSGGKDSTAMLLRMLEEKMPVDIILFCDTGLDFPEMYDHIKKVEKYTNRKVTVVRSEYDFEYLFHDKPINRKPDSIVSKQYGGVPTGYGWAGPQMRWCTSVLKDRPRERFLREYSRKYNIIEYVGIAADEKYRLDRKTNSRDNSVHPLVDWNMTESDCLAYCYERGFDWGGLYNYFSRVSCWCCPLQPLRELRVLYEHFPKLWEQLKVWDDMTWRKFRPDYSVKELEIKFELEKEWLSQGKKLRTKEFFTELKTRLEGME